MNPVQRKDHLDGLAIGILVLCCMFWGLQQILVKLTLPEVPPVMQAALRCVGATLLLFVWCRWRGIALFRRDGSLWAGLLAGALFAAEFAFIYQGLLHTSASRLTVFLYTSPFWVAALVPVFVKSEHLRPLQWLGLVCAFIAVVFALREGMGGGSARGDLMGLLAGAFWGLTTVSIRATNLTRISPEKLLFYQIAFTAVSLSGVSLALGETWSFNWSRMAWTIMAVQAGAQWQHQWPGFRLGRRSAAANRLARCLCQRHACTRQDGAARTDRPFGAGRGGAAGASLHGPGVTGDLPVGPAGASRV